MPPAPNFLGFQLAVVLVLLAALAGCSRSPQSIEADHLGKARGYLSQGNYRKAVIEFKIASQVMPGDAEPIYQLGLTHLRRDAWRPAIEAFQRATDLNPKHEGALRQLALFKVASNKPELLTAAQQFLTGHIARHPADAEALGALAVANAKLGDKNKAIDLLKLALERSPAELRPARLLIALYTARGDTSTAQVIARTVVEKLPNSPDAFVLFAHVSLSASELSLADAQIHQALLLKKDFLPALQLQLSRQLMSGDTQGAEQTARQLSRLPDRQVWAAYARLLFSKKKTDQGIQEFRSVLKEHGETPELRDEFSALLLAAGRIKEADEAVNATLARYPKDTPALLQRVRRRVDQGKLEGAIQDVNALIELKAFSTELSYQQARIFGARGEKIKAEDLLGEALRSNPRFLEARLQSARLLVSSGKAKDALIILDHASAVEIQRADYLYSRNAALMAADKWDEARKGVDKGLAMTRSAHFLYQDAVLRLKDRDLAGARKSLESGFQLAPSDSDILTLLGAVMSRQGETLKYISMLKEAAARSLGSAPAQNALGSQLAQAGDRKGALAAFHAAQSAGDTTNAQLEIALLELRSGELDRAKERTIDLLKKDDNAPARLLLAEIETRKGSDPDIVVKHYLRVIELQPENLTAINNLADTLASRQNKYDDAMFWARKAMALSPSSPMVQDTVGWIYYLQGRYGDALPYLEKSLAGLDRPVGHYHLAAELFRAGDRGRGRREYELALKMDPQSAARASVAPLFEGK